MVTILNPPTPRTPPRPKSSLLVEDQEKRVQTEINHLVSDIKRINPEGSPYCTFGELFTDPLVEQYYEALVGTLKAAKKKGVISFKGQLLLKGMHDHVLVTLVEGDNKTKDSSGSIGTKDVREQTEEKVQKAFTFDTHNSRPQSEINKTKFMKNIHNETSGESGRNQFQPSVVYRKPEERKKKKKNKPMILIDTDTNLTMALDGEKSKESTSRDDITAVSFATAPVFGQTSLSKENTFSRQKDDDMIHTKSAGLTFHKSVPTSGETHNERVERETNQLVHDIRRITPEGEGFCAFGDLFDDSEVEQYYEALVGTLKAAKRKGMIQFKGQMLFKGMHDNVQIRIID